MLIDSAFLKRNKKNKGKELKYNITSCFGGGLDENLTSGFTIFSTIFFAFGGGGVGTGVTAWGEGVGKGCMQWKVQIIRHLLDTHKWVKQMCCMN